MIINIFMLLLYYFFVCFKQKTADERRISDWSSDVCSSDLVTLTIADSGPGIPEEIQSRIFEPFFTTKDIGEGTGVGLAVSHRIVEAHEGRIRVDSALGKGSAFTVTLPVGTAAAVQAPQPRAAAQIGRASWRERGCQTV